MTYYETKTNRTIKTVPEIKKDLEELKFGCEVKLGVVWGWYWIDNITTRIIRRCEWLKWEVYNVEWNPYCLVYVKHSSFPEDPSMIKEIIWNPLEERHLRMYCEKKGILWFLWINKIELWIPWNESNALWCRIDNTKSFNDQTEEVYEKIVEFLTK